MLRNMYNKPGFLSMLYPVGRKALNLWEKQMCAGQIRFMTDKDLQSLVLEVVGPSVYTTFITSPPDPRDILGLELPILGLIVKNLNIYFMFEVLVQDDKNLYRLIQVCNYHLRTTVQPFICILPLHLVEGWNHIQINLRDLTKRAFGTKFIETVRVKIHANCRIRRVYFSDRVHSEDELPEDFKLRVPDPTLPAE